jgi:hypothetical protein
VWILDAYTTTKYYPYSQRFDLGDFVEHSQSGALDGSANYVRNSVKVVVDAYDGTIDFYIIDESDPLIRAWRNAFPDLFTDEEPSIDLQEHFRYPEDLFKIQSEVYTTYHITDPDDFFAKEDVWAIPNVAGETAQAIGELAPTYLLTQLPGETDQEFVLTRPFTPRARANMIAFMVARSDPGSYGDLVTLLFPRSRQVPGPVQVNNLINQDVEFSQTRTLLGQEGSDVSFGSLIILPIEDSILYVQPLFVTADTEGIPELKRVLVVFGEKVAMATTFDDALAELFALEPGAEPTPTPTPTGGEEEPQGGNAARLAALIEKAGNVYERAQAALADGDFETYGRLIEKLGRLLSEAQSLAD